MLFLSPYEPAARRPAKKELHARCHEMAALAIRSLPAIEA